MNIQKQTPISYGLIFDVDGVIADSETVNVRASVKVFEDMFALRDVIKEDFEAGLGRGAEAYMRAAAVVHGLELTKEQALEAVQARQDNFLSILKSEPLPAFPGVLELMYAAMAKEDFAVAIATSSTVDKSRAVLESAGVPYQEMAYVTGNDVTHKKPDPELFLLAAEKINVSPERCLVVEDAPNGIQAALSAGAKVLAVSNSTTADKLSKAHTVVESLSGISLDEVIKLIEG